MDDATATTLGRMGAEEIIWTVAGVLQSWIEKHGVPLALYKGLAGSRPDVS